MKCVLHTWYLCQLLGFCLSVLNLPLSALLWGSGTLQTTVLFTRYSLLGSAHGETRGRLQGCRREKERAPPLGAGIYFLFLCGSHQQCLFIPSRGSLNPGCTSPLTCRSSLITPPWRHQPHPRALSSEVLGPTCTLLLSSPPLGEVDVSHSCFCCDFLVSSFYLFSLLVNNIIPT